MRLKQQSSVWLMATPFLFLLVVAVLGYAAYYVAGLSSGEPSAPVTDTAVMSVPKGEIPDKEQAMQEKVVFENQTLKEILDKLSVYYHVGVRYEEESLMDLRLYFNWNPSEDIGNVLIILSNFDHINLNLEDDTIVVSK